MSWFTDVRDTTLKGLGLDSAENVVKTAGSVARDAIGGNEVKKEPPVAQRNPFEMMAEAADGLSDTQIAGLSLPVVLLLGAGAYYFFKR